MPSAIASSPPAAARLVMGLLEAGIPLSLLADLLGVRAGLGEHLPDRAHRCAPAPRTTWTPTPTARTAAPACSAATVVSGSRARGRPPS